MYKASKLIQTQKFRPTDSKVRCISKARLHTARYLRTELKPGVRRSATNFLCSLHLHPNEDNVEGPPAAIERLGLQQLQAATAARATGARTYSQTKCPPSLDRDPEQARGAEAPRAASANPIRAIADRLSASGIAEDSSVQLPPRARDERSIPPPHRRHRHQTDGPWRSGQDMSGFGMGWVAMG